jgi:hypothetical protein
MASRKSSGLTGLPGGIRQTRGTIFLVPLLAGFGLSLLSVD